jgi:hypothetical protein
MVHSRQGETSMNDLQYLSIKKVLENPKYPFSKGQLRHFLTKRHNNGLEKAIRKIGKRIYFRSDLLDAWIETQGKGVVE